MTQPDSASDAASQTLAFVTSAIGGALITLLGFTLWTCDDESLQFGDLPFGHYSREIPGLAPKGPFAGIGCVRPLMAVAASPVTPWAVGLVAAGVVYGMVRLFARPAK